MWRPLNEYANRFETIRLERTDGILTLTLHTNGGPVEWDDRMHAELGHCFTDIAADRGNDVLIITGSGDSFIDTHTAGPTGGAMTAEFWDTVYSDGKRLLTALLDIEIPVIAAVNGPATIHAELALLSDIVICSPDTVFADEPHFPAGFVAGDGVQLLWPLLLGPNRARYFMLTGQRLSAQEALSLGVVGEVVTREDLLGRADALARQILRRPNLLRRYTRVALTHELRRLVHSSLDYGLALEGLAAIHHLPHSGEFD
jgi:enoyl-CoA hydratase/carnithine racemase